MLVQNRCKYFECCFWSTFLIPDNRILTPISIGINDHKKFIDFRYLSIDYYRHLISFNDNRLSKLSTSCFRANNFCLAQMTQELSKKHNEVGPPEQLPSGALSQFDNGHNRHWRLLVPTNNAKARGMRMAEWKIKSPPAFQNAPQPLLYESILSFKSF